MTNNTTFSIITVSYNSVSTIEQTIQSVLNQTYQNYEYIIIDGGSTDGTTDIISGYVRRFNGRLKWVSEPDDGIYSAMNKGIKKASGRYIGLLNSDDWYNPDALENVNASIDENNAIIFGLLSTWSNGNLNRVYANFTDNLHSDSLAHPSSFIPKATYDKYGVYDTKYKSAADYELFLRLYNVGCNFKFICSILANFRLGGTSCSSLGFFETLEIKKNYNLLSKKRYIKLFYKRRITDFLQMLEKKLF